MIMKEESMIMDSLKKLTPVKVIVLAGSRGRGYQDRWSDIDYYIYYSGKLPDEKRRKNILSSSGFDAVCSGSMDFFSIKGTDAHNMWIEVKFPDKMISLLEDGVYESNVESNIAHFIQNVRPLYDPSGILRKWKKASVYRESMRKSICQRNDLGSVANIYRDGLEILLKRKNLFMIDWKMDMGINKIIRVIYALNRRYYSDYPNWIKSELRDFRIKPSRFYERLRDFSSLGTGKNLERKLEILNGLLTDTIKILGKEYPDIETGGKIFPEYRNMEWYRKRMKEISKMLRNQYRIL